MNKLEEEKDKISKLFEEYRKSGLALMTTIVGLSSGAFAGLFQNKETRKLSFLYVMPIAIALMQQLAYYLGSHKKAISRFHGLVSSRTDDPDKGMDTYVYKKENFEKAKLLYDVSDKFCIASCLSLGLVTFYPIMKYASATVAIVIVVILVICLSYWFARWFKLIRKLKKTDWFNNE
jgi:Flp pilus assembly protein TadB